MTPPTAPAPPRWLAAGPLADLDPGTLRTLKREGHQLVLGRTEDGDVFALDNRCPHEGYPLAQGDLKGCALTCCWHNWKFDVRDGACMIGGEAVRAYPVRVVEGEVEVDLADPDPEESFPAWRESLCVGLFKHENGRAIRDGVRLLSGGYDPWRLLGDIARYDALHAEYGCTHALPVAADCGRLVERRAGVEAMYAIAPAIDSCGDGNRRMPPRPIPEPVRGATGEDLRRAVEAEEVERSEAIVRGAFADGLPRAEIERWIFAALSDHFLDFGHPLIYLVKAGELCGRVDDGYAVDLHAGLVVRIVYGTREDTLPYMEAYARRLREIEARLPGLWDHARTDAPFDPVALRDAVLDGTNQEAFDAVLAPLEAGVPPGQIAAALVGAAAHRLYRFDDSLDRNPDYAENWLWGTHRFTFSSAVRNAVERFDSPDALRFLFQAVMFIHSGRRMDLPAEKRVPLDAEASSAEGVLEAIADRDPEAAVRRTLGFVRSEEPIERLKTGVEELLLQDPLVRPIVVAHAIKNATAAFEEYGAMEDHPDREIVLLANMRFLASPVVERRVAGAVKTSIEWVVEGKVPKKLTQ